MKNKYSLLSLAGVCLYLLTACSNSSDDQADKKALEKVSLRLAWVYDMAEVGIFVAKDKGFYEERGLDLEIRPGGFGLDPFKLVANEEDDFGVGGAVNLLLAREKGIPVVAVAAEFQNTPVGFMTRENSGIDDFSDFKGKRVGVQTGSDTDTLFRALLSKSSLEESDIDLVPIQYSAVPFVAGKIDVLPGYVTNQPITLASKGIDVNVITAASQGFDVYGNVYFVKENRLAENPESVEKFIQATLKGWKYAFNHPEEAVAAVSKRSDNFSEEDLRRIYNAVMPFVKGDDNSTQTLRMNREKWTNTYELLKASGLSKQPEPVEDAFTLEMLK